LGCNHCLIFIMVIGYLNWCWIFCTNLYNNTFNVLLWKHLVNFENNLMSMEYPKPFIKNVTNISFSIIKGLKNKLKWFENEKKLWEFFNV
jgi:hypothetical protein